MKLSKIQEEVIRLMKEGYYIELFRHTDGLIKGSLRKPGERFNVNTQRKVNLNTWESLQRKGLIERDRSHDDPFYITRYMLVDKGEK